MRGTYHICWASHQEVMFRDSEDLARLFNAIAIAILSTGSRLLCDAEMSTHLHIGIQSDNPKLVIRKIRYGYTRYFNAKYHRTGPIGERYVFCDKIIGPKRIVAMISYICRQGLHHGVSSTPFDYPNCSCNEYFKRQLGKNDDSEDMMTEKRYRTIPQHKKVPLNIRMNQHGQLYRSNIVDSAYVEELFISPKSFLFNMTRFSDDNWVKEQKEENVNLDIVDISSIERSFSKDDRVSMIKNERQRFDPTKPTDMEICEIIDHEILPVLYGKKGTRTIYDLSIKERERIADQVCSRLIKSKRWPNIPSQAHIKQINRCLALL